ncbi:MAG TPA: maltose alpha-D-glucosyltransferase [Vicinamibacterales bacterium]|nr:maltose alpha-D-glucosyltransferase [Vicinamibacterales bacterium]
MSSDSAWYKDAIIYELHVRSFFDANGDGIGDFKGLIQKLDYIQDLGVNTIWLLPFYPSPLKDDGYDIANYRDIHPSYGTLRDFRLLLKEAHARGLRVFTELVVNHTSDQHPWFQAARQAPTRSAKRDYYVWSDAGSEYSSARTIFTDTETSNWTWDPIARQYFWHRFFSHQPDLNFDNPRVLKGVIDVMQFWLDMGVDGLRLDAVPYLIEREGTNCENLKETHDILKQLRRKVDQRFPDRALLAEANQWPADVRPYFGDGDECHMAYHFPLMPRIFMAVRQEDALPIVEIMRQTPEIPPNCQWALFLRNHDELTLEMVTDEERDYMYTAYAADPQMRLNVGIRRRLAPLMEHNRPLIELLNSLLLSMPGSPIIYYGDELGMGDNVYLGDRNGVRTPMQWTGDRNAGFSRADPARLFAPPVMDPVYGYQAINVEAQERSPSSLLNWMRRMLRLRRQHPTLGRGTFDSIATNNRHVLAFVREDAQQQILVVANMARTAQPVHLDLQRFDGRHPVELIGNTELPPVAGDPYFLTLAPHGFFWFQLAQVSKPIVLQRPRLQGRDEPVPKLLVSAVWESLLDSHTRTLVERDALIGFLSRQRWYAAKARQAVRTRFADWTMLDGTPPLFLCIAEVEYDDGVFDRYALVLAAVAGDAANQVVLQRPASVLARLSGARSGVLYDGMTDPVVAKRVMDLMRRGGTISMRSGTVSVSFSEPTSPFPADEGQLRTHIPMVEQSNSSVLIGDKYLLKVFRRLQTGENPDIEIGRTLGMRANEARVPALLAWAEYQAPGASPTSIAMVQQQVASRGSSWQRALDEMRSYSERALVAHRARADRGERGPLTAGDIEDRIGVYRATIELLGRRTADLHRTLAGLEREGFGVLPFPREELEKLVRNLKAHATRSLDMARDRRSTLPDATGARVDALLAQADAIDAALERILTIDDAGKRIRTHSDFHLGQVLEVDGDVFFIDFEGEPARPIAERRLAQSPLRDVAGMIRSFGYAARAGFKTLLEAHPESAPILEPWISGWELHTSAAYLSAYLKSVEDSGLLPTGINRDLLLRAFLLDKAFYELSYELNNRPGWVDIPVDGLLRLLQPADA